MTKPTSAGQADDALVRLARERFDLPDQVRRLARPPVPSLEPPYGLRVAQLTDAEMLAEWMNRPHLAAAWEYDWPASRWRQHLNAQLEGTYSLPLIGSWHGTDGGYLELYWAAKDLISHYYDADPYDLGCTRPSRTCRRSIGASARCCYRGSWPASLPTSRVAGGSCSTPITATPRPVGCVSGPDASSSVSMTRQTGAWRSTLWKLRPRLRNRRDRASCRQPPIPTAPRRCRRRPGRASCPATICQASFRRQDNPPHRRCACIRR